MTGTSAAAPSRRQFLLGQKVAQSPVVPRPPYSSTDSITAHCTACGDCLSACPEAILVADQNGKPFVDFSDGECTFCNKCSDICTEPVFDQSSAPFLHLVEIGTNCLMHQSVECRVCAENCDAGAMTFDYQIGRSGGVHLNPQDCTGCGACIAPCPADAISIAFPKSEVAA
ncbi:MAG: ferredoxin-type protein NapF [Pseudoruegeria sp.]